jgi:hypothetical protein
MKLMRHQVCCGLARRFEYLGLDKKILNSDLWATREISNTKEQIQFPRIEWMLSDGWVHLGDFNTIAAGRLGVVEGSIGCG